VTWSYLVYGLWFLAWVVLEALGLTGRVPWRTLSETAWSLERLSKFFRLIFLAGLTVLTAHIVWRFP